jgi:DNA polymerase I-like protein with 3'-5' exonuclease and polymerase domains
LLVERARRELGRLLGREIGPLPPKGREREEYARKLREEAERQAFNHLIQGTGMETLKQAMLRVERAALPDVHPLLAIHDELVYEIPEDGVFVAGAIAAAMGATFGGVRLTTSAAVAADWGSLK